MNKRSLILVLSSQLLLLASCTSTGQLATSGKPLDKEATRLAICEGAQKVDIAFQTIAGAAPGLIPAQIMDTEGAVIGVLGFQAGSPDAASPSSVCAKLYSGDLDVAINTAILATVQISKLIQTWRPAS